MKTKTRHRIAALLLAVAVVMGTAAGSCEEDAEDLQEVVSEFFADISDLFAPDND